MSNFGTEINLPFSPGQPPSPPAPGKAQDIYNAAVQLMGERAYADVSVEDILQRANVSRQTFYRFYRNKTELYHVIYAIASEQMVMIIKGVDHSGPLSRAEKMVESLLTNAFMLAQAGGGVLLVFLREGAKPDSEFAPYRRRVFDALQEDVQAWLKEQGREIDPLLVKGGFLAVEQLLFDMMAEKSVDEVLRKRYENVARVLLSGIICEVLLKS